ncbi:MAG: ATP-binding cassette domain-containing protein [Actinomycetota bacterium]|nr:ATP-binding cassette domain-containing protein [Actinomycetota bacterium]
MSDLMIDADRLSISFGSVTALQSVSIAAARGSVLGLLGHNGAGKTTLVNILATLVVPDSGTARVGGFDVVRQPREVRRRIGLTGQYAAVDEQLSGRDNLRLIAGLLGAGRKEARARADELLEAFDLSGAAVRRARTYSGGMRRRLDLAASLVGSPEVLFLDEPTTGLDPQARLAVWDNITELTREGTTVLLTTQYLDEADRLADTITVLSAGQVVASGTTAELKAKVGRRTVTTTFTTASDPAAAVATAAAALAAAGLDPVPDPGSGSVITPAGGAHDVTTIILAIDRAGLEATELRITEPTLDDVYLAVADAGRPAHLAAAARPAA